MKNDLTYQSTEFDCGPTTVVNAIRFLFERKEIPPALIKGIWNYGNDTYGDQGHAGKRGTSKACIRYMATWLTGFAEGYQMPLKAEFAEDEAAQVVPGSRTWQCLEAGGAALVRCWSEGIGHYVLLTTLLRDKIGLFDPYFEPDDTVMDTPGVVNVHDQPGRMNRIVPVEVINRTDKTDYALGEVSLRENLLFWRTDK